MASGDPWYSRVVGRRPATGDVRESVVRVTTAVTAVTTEVTTLSPETWRCDDVRYRPGGIYENEVWHGPRWQTPPAEVGHSGSSQWREGLQPAVTWNSEVWSGNWSPAYDDWYKEAWTGPTEAVVADAVGQMTWQRGAATAVPAWHPQQVIATGVEGRVTKNDLNRARGLPVWSKRKEATDAALMSRVANFYKSREEAFRLVWAGTNGQVDFITWRANNCSTASYEAHWQERQANEPNATLFKLEPGLISWVGRTMYTRFFSCGGGSSALVEQARRNTLRRSGSMVFNTGDLLYLTTLETQLAACTKWDPPPTIRSESELLQLTIESHSCDDSSFQPDPFKDMPVVTQANFASTLVATIVDANEESAAAAASQVAWDRSIKLLDEAEVEEWRKYGRRLFSQPGSKFLFF